ncbi:DgyrCDS8397 [Dimorphilus gyrociliatus]|uniref:DNA polymerase n=1 Tax=Dimorphilus gyrociliatus TaxID=2664684 RepID=A0A7I8VWD0_9ANNE|nr:DgyrCDS8397 [Dimorphilus gyrociliatus]
MSSVISEEEAKESSQKMDNESDCFIITPQTSPPTTEEITKDQSTPTSKPKPKLLTSTPRISIESTDQNTPGLALTPISETLSQRETNLLRKSLSLERTPVSRENSQKRLKRKKRLTSNASCIEELTPENTYNFRLDSLRVDNEKTIENMTVMSLELFTETRQNLLPNPEYDQIIAIFYSIYEDSMASKEEFLVGCMIVEGSEDHIQCHKENVLHIVQDEATLFEELVRVVRSHDPDIFIGFEIDTLSWGYLLDRAKIYDIKTSFQDKHSMPGRIVLNLWKVLRHELTLNIYTFENVHFHVLHRRVPKYDWPTLQSLWKWNRWRLMDYFYTRVVGNNWIILQLNLIGQTSELARVFGIEFRDVLSRGSQYRVESMMLRVSRSRNYVPASPSVEQRSRQKAPECVPLNMEPHSKVYKDPVIVLDFQSLYPSIMIAYNICFTTCLGKLYNLKNCDKSDIELGCCQYSIDPQEVVRLADKNLLYVSPNKVVFVKQEVRTGVISDLVDDLIETRQLVKARLKECDDKSKSRLLQARQLGLKLAANTTYGYTAASFSGRMPCVEVADAIVQTARKTLENAIELVKKEFPMCKILYGDTDSMFVLTPGKTVAEAFELGKQMVKVVTDANPPPVKLKLEKVYSSSVLQAKKRYAGWAYESPDGEPFLDCKGIETVRRDSCPVVSKILAKTLNLLLRAPNIQEGVRLVKEYVLKQCSKVLAGRVNVQDFILAKEYRGSYKQDHIPAALIARKRLAADPRSEPKISERVPYVIISGPPGVRLKDNVREPIELLVDSSLRINADYYLSKQILPPLHRVLSLIGIDVFSWYQEIPRTLQLGGSVNANKKTISQFFMGAECAICSSRVQPKSIVCSTCRESEGKCCLILEKMAFDIEKAYINASKICKTCKNYNSDDKECKSFDCPVLFRIEKFRRKLDHASLLRDAAKNLNSQ